jgi:hypothetical protein
MSWKRHFTTKITDPAPTFVEALRRDEIRKLAKESSENGVFTLDDQPEPPKEYPYYDGN